MQATATVRILRTPCATAVFMAVTSAQFDDVRVYQRALSAEEVAEAAEERG